MLRFLLLFVFGFGLAINGQAQKKTVEIKTSAVCEMCKEKIENKLNYSKGIRFADLDVPSKVVTVTYNSKKTTPEEIKTLITLLGYNADDQQADPKAFGELHYCCKPDSR